MQERVIVLRSDPQLIFPTQSFPRPLMFIRTGWNFCQNETTNFLNIYLCMHFQCIREQWQCGRATTTKHQFTAPNRQQSTESTAAKTFKCESSVISLSVNETLTNPTVERAPKDWKYATGVRVVTFDFAIQRPFKVFPNFTSSSKFKIFNI